MICQSIHKTILWYPSQAVRTITGEMEGTADFPAQSYGWNAPPDNPGYPDNRREYFPRCPSRFINSWILTFISSLLLQPVNHFFQMFHCLSRRKYSGAYSTDIPLPPQNRSGRSGEKTSSIPRSFHVISSSCFSSYAVPDSCPVLQTAPVNIPSVVLFRNFHEDTS